MRDCKQPLEKVRDVQPSTVGVSERLVATLWFLRDSERQQETIRDSERHAEIL